MTDILIADDHPLFRDALQRAVQTALPAAQVHTADSVTSLFAVIAEFPDADLLLIDLHMPGAQGFSALAHIRGQYPGLPIIVVSMHEEARIMQRALTHGASAYIPKSAPAGEIVAAIESVLRGDVWVPRDMFGAPAGPSALEIAAAARVATLTPHQFRVMTMLSDGMLNKQIAFDLNVSEATIKAHMTAIMRKLGVNNRTQVALFARMLAVDEEEIAAPTDARP